MSRENWETKTIYITEYATTMGIKAIPAQINPETGTAFPEPGHPVKYSYHEGDYYLDKEEAIGEVRKKIHRKMAALNKFLDKLNEL